MKISEAISKKLNKICKEKNISVNKLANMSLLTQSTVEHLVNGDSKNPKLLTIIRICDGLGMSLQEFFADDLFRNMDRED
jgi:transcriptional regulator with XRE-family HTH domain